MIIIGKNLKGKSLGVGLSQRKDGKYSARFTNQKGKRIEKYFDTLPEAKCWLEDAKYEDKHGILGASEDITVDAWFEYWIKNIKSDNIRTTTKNNYSYQYKLYVKEYIGFMLLKNVKPLHCQELFNALDKRDLASSTMEQVKILLVGMFLSAVENEYIEKTPMRRSVKYNKKNIKKQPLVLTVSEQEAFKNVIRGLLYENAFRLVLETGLRAGEVSALSWDDVDFENKIIHVRHTYSYDSESKEMILGLPKTDKGMRDIPMTQECYDILSQQKKQSAYRVVNIKYAKLVFHDLKGCPVVMTNYDSCIRNILKKINIKHFSMHTLRHTFATRCIEAGMRPKTLQVMLGHSNLSITMDLYVHVTEDESVKEMKKLENHKMA